MAQRAPIGTHGLVGRALEGKPGDPEFAASYHRAIAGRVAPKTGTLQEIISRYQQSLAFNDLKASTKVGYAQHIVRIEKSFADFPLASLVDSRSRDDFLKWRDDIGKTAPRSADFAWTVLKTILNWAKDRGLITAHPCERGGRLYNGDRSDKIWTPEDEAKFLANAPKRFRLPLILALETGQRQADLLHLPWSAYDGNEISLTQRKTGIHVVIPVTTKLKIALAAAPKVSPWKTNSFSRGFHDAAIAAGITGLTFHDARGTCVTRLALAECTIPQIIAITGHSPKDAGRIVNKYLSRDPALARAAIRKLETRTVQETKLANGENS